MAATLESLADTLDKISGRLRDASEIQGDRARLRRSLGDAIGWLERVRKADADLVPEWVISTLTQVQVETYKPRLDGP